ncbi:MAG: hypothetical protein V3W34_15195 [Phycisphaerae bacterium]
MSMLFKVNIAAARSPDVNQTHSVVRRHSPTPEALQGDRLELSQPVAELTNLEQVRTQRLERIQRVRLEIASQIYETRRKADVTVERVFAELSALDLHA